MSDNLWAKYDESTIRYNDLGFEIDFSRVNYSYDCEAGMKEKVEKAVANMQALEAGEVVNPDEDRMVGHYWLRNADLAPNDEVKAQITEPLNDLKDFAKKVHAGAITTPGGQKFQQILLIGIGGSALGPQLVDDAIGNGAKLPIFFFDNTDPEGIDRTVSKLGKSLAVTLTLVISKSGGTAETRNGMLEAKSAYEALGLKFENYAVAITGDGSKLDGIAKTGNWLKIFPMEDWVGGRTSVMSTVGLVPAAVQGIDIDSFLKGASDMDEKTRSTVLENNAALQLALAWYTLGNGKGEKDMVVLPYKDSLVLFSKYLQQLVMESLGKELDLDGNVVNQGIAVYGNKGSTDQHAYVQQLRDGVHNFFVTFIEVQKARSGSSIEVEEDTTSGDFLQGFLRGTRKALYESDRQSITISIPEVTPYSLGLLIGLFERAVTFYASLVNINAYHQPGVEAGKKAAGAFLDTLKATKSKLTSTPATAAEIAVGIEGGTEEVYHSLRHLAANSAAEMTKGDKPSEDTFKLV